MFPGISRTSSLKRKLIQSSLLIQLNSLSKLLESFTSQKLSTEILNQKISYSMGRKSRSSIMPNRLKWTRNSKKSIPLAVQSHTLLSNAFWESNKGSTNNKLIFGQSQSCYTNSLLSPFLSSTTAGSVEISYKNGEAPPNSPFSPSIANAELFVPSNPFFLW